MSKNRKEKLRTRLQGIPTAPGVYLWLDDKGKILYVGKAKNLRSRLHSYLRTERGRSPWKQALCEQFADIEITVTQNEFEALMLETNLIKAHRPKYNVVMKDDKNHIFLRIDLCDPCPSVTIVRRVAQDKSRYFGPYQSMKDLLPLLDMLHTLFQYRVCKKILTRKKITCLEHQIGKCNGLCIGKISPKEHKEAINKIVKFFRGEHKEAIEQARNLMAEAAQGKKFERAAEYRDILHTIEKLEQTQNVTSTSTEDADIIGIAPLARGLSLIVLHKRQGNIVQTEHRMYEGTAESLTECLEQALAQYYAVAANIPPRILLPCLPEHQETLQQWIEHYHGCTTRFILPKHRQEKELLILAERNAQERAIQEETKWEAEKNNARKAVEELQRTLNLRSPPQRIEGYDISHTNGTETVGSMVVMRGGRVAKDQYRSFIIRTLKEGTIDDYAALREVLTRRLRHRKGSLQEKLLQWKEKNIIIRKARKGDRKNIKALIETYPQNLSVDDLDKGQFFVAEKKGDIVGCCRLFSHKTGLRELRSVCIAASERGKRLGHTVIRLLLTRKDQGKIYSVIDPTLETYYTEIGFRHIRKTPPILAKKVRRILQEEPNLHPPLVMVYDPAQHRVDTSLQTKPDLLVIDGGKGQLHAVETVLRQMSLDIPVIALAKEREEVFRPQEEMPVHMEKNSPEHFLLMRLRDEAHRFANALRRKRLHGKLHDAFAATQKIGKKQ